MELQSLDKMLSIKFTQNMTFKVCIILYLIRQTIPAEKKVAIILLKIGKF